MAKSKKEHKKRTGIAYRTNTEPKAYAGETPVFCAHDEIVSIGEVHGNPKNPNTHPKAQIDLLADIIQAQGWRAPITISRRSGFIVKGHGRLAAAIELGEVAVPVDYQDYNSEAEEMADLIADNRLAELAELDKSSLTELLTELDTGEVPIELTGYTEEDLESLIGALSGVDDAEDDQIDSVPEPPRIAISKAGDLWEVGLHRIICGDATDAGTIARLMGDDLAQVVNTDPPYGVSYNGGLGTRDENGVFQDNGWSEISHDELTGDELINKLLLPALRNCVKYAKEDAAFYIWHASMTTVDFWEALTRAGLMVRQVLIWVKEKFAMGRSDYQWQHEPCFYAEKAGRTAKWCGDRSQATTWKVIRSDEDGAFAVLTGGVVVMDGEGHKVFVSEKPSKGKKIRYIRLSNGRSITLIPEEPTNTVWEVQKDTGAEHPTQKPVELAVRAITNSSEYGDVVCDFFGGSHSTMVGAELTGRRARICELEPKYVDVGILRYVKLKGTRGITCIRDGKRIDFLELCQHTADEHGITIEGLIDGDYEIPGGDS